jgi:rRNA maturation RNase YbeY
MKRRFNKAGEINIFNLIPNFKFPRKIASNLVVKVVEHFHHQIENINIIFLDNKSIKLINKLYLFHKYATDVISFRLNQGKKIEGEIYIGVEVAKKNSILYNVRFYDEIKRLIIHGCLHMIGFKDKYKKEKNEMTKWEERFLQ